MAKARVSPSKIVEQREPVAERVLTTDDVALMFGVSAQAVRDWRHLEVGPEYFRTPGGQVRYRESAVAAWIEARTVRH